jgi:hypothetical protein
MALPSEDDRDAIDRAFAELVAGYHLTADQPDLLIPESLDEPTRPEPVEGHSSASSASPTSDVGENAAKWAADHPLFGFLESPTEASTAEPTEERYVPEPLPPLQRPAAPALLGWIGIGYAIVLVLAATLGLRFPAWMGWVAVGSFVGGFGILMTRLPRERPPGSGDGAVL